MSYTPVLGALALPDGRILSWASDKTLRIWDSRSWECLAVLEGHSEPVKGALVLPDERILSWASGLISGTHAPRIWDSRSGKCLLTLEGHSQSVKGALVLPNCRILSWAGETLRIWDRLRDTEIASTPKSV
jgi:WD40 repeat protein